MEALILFLSKSIVISGLLTAWYLLGLCGRRLHQYNRFFLLSILFASLTIPILHFQLFNISRPVVGGLAPVARFIQASGDFGGGSNAVQVTAHTQSDWLAIVALAVGGISLTLLMILSVRVFKVLRMCRQYAVTQLEGINLVLTDSPRAPFTFLRYIFWNRSMPLQDEIGELIFRHELTHLKQGHTYDKLVCQALTCIFWFNPFYWIIQKELNIVHEFVADENAIDGRDTGAFAIMLLRSYNNGSYLVPQHHFFASTTKRRLAMLQNAAKPSYASLRRFMAVPFIAGIILLFSFGCNNTAAVDIVPAKKKIVLLLDAGHGGQDAGAHAGGYIEKDICLKYAKRLKELASAYNIDVQLTRDDDRYMVLANRVALSNKIHPDAFISLHVGDEPGNEQEKGDFDICVSGENGHAMEAGKYSSSIFLAMAQNGIIPGISIPPVHVHTPGCNCGSCVSQRAAQDAANAKISATEKEGIYVLKHVQVPGMMVILGNIRNQVEMRQLTTASRLDAVCNAVLKGIVAGAKVQDSFTSDPLNILPAGKGDGTCR